MSKLPSRTRAGYTIIELLVAIFIIGLLMALAVTGVRQAMIRARTGAALIEIGKISDAIENWKSKVGDYPPCMGDVLATHTGNIPGRQDRFITALRRAFPRYVTVPSVGGGSAPGPVTYNNVGLYIAQTYRTATGALNINTMDQAEALVFWLGGLPTPYSANAGIFLGSRKLCGFHNNPSNPFQFDVPTASATSARSTAGIDFDDTRLVDSDGDGWFEYVPKLLDAAMYTPPYVYFDANLYGQVNPLLGVGIPTYYAYPSPTLSGTSVPVPGQAWGYAVPWATRVVAGSINQWIKPGSFQIICAGLDSAYSDAVNTPANRIPVLPVGQAAGQFSVLPPTGQVYWLGNQSFEPLDAFEQDNLANFSDSTMFDASQAAGS
ncbi:MAG TPA: prepilin-type N-terminal cleavage/methylation domain-containing protein [Pirellulales bacterium]|jgi:prepilin-type N-terminal cleavage/methylation domain-containing protein|nr:prepilin-type N-terminal cleavage/methylation domain-containing protein [Pirellulales bacterium]